jgi:hypothetical protein
MSISQRGTDTAEVIKTSTNALTDNPSGEPVLAGDPPAVGESERSLTAASRSHSSSPTGAWAA